jgi:cytoskeletal protein RodZ
MTLHIIRDKKGRMEKILDDKEYDRHQARKGCFQFLFFVAIVGLTIYGSATQESDDSSKVQTETVAESEETDEIAETNAVETEDRNGMKEEETVSAEEDYVEEITTETEDTSSVIDDDELVQRFLKNQ